jgi:hypothetical protein
VTQSYRIFFATDLRLGAPRRDREEQDLVSQAFPLKVFEQMMIDGAIRDAGTVATFGLLRLKGLI